MLNEEDEESSEMNGFGSNAGSAKRGSDQVLLINTGAKKGKHNKRYNDSESQASEAMSANFQGVKSVKSKSSKRSDKKSSKGLGERVSKMRKLED